MSHEDYRRLFSADRPAAAQPSGEAEARPPAGAQPCAPSTFKENESRAARALAYAMDIRKFEIELYWKRATYFWTFIAAAFAGYALTYKTSSEHEPWLSLVFSALGLVFSFAWYLVNRGSKYWQNNWERHVDLLEDITLGPLYKIRAEDDAAKRSWLTGPGEFSVSKINQLLSLFVVLIWCCLLVKSLKLPWPPVDLALGPFEMMVLAITAVGLFMLWYKGRSSNVETAVKLKRRNLKE